MDQAGAVRQAVDDASWLHFGDRKLRNLETHVFKALNYPRLVQDQKELLKQGRLAPLTKESDDETGNQETPVAPENEDDVA